MKGAKNANPTAETIEQEAAETTEVDDKAGLVARSRQAVIRASRQSRLLATKERREHKSSGLLGLEGQRPTPYQPGATPQETRPRHDPGLVC